MKFSAVLIAASAALVSAQVSNSNSLPAPSVPAVDTMSAPSAPAGETMPAPPVVSMKATQTAFVTITASACEPPVYSDRAHSSGLRPTKPAPLPSGKVSGMPRPPPPPGSGAAGATGAPSPPSGTNSVAAASASGSAAATYTGAASMPTALGFAGSALGLGALIAAGLA